MKILELGHIVLYVTDLEKSVHFYNDILGFNLLDRQTGVAVFSGGRTHHEMLLIEVGGTPKTSRSMEPGLYHIGFKIGDGPEALKAVYEELKDKDVRIIGSTDHGVTHSLYILDPDGNELELYSDFSDEWKTNPKAIMSPAKSLPL